MKLDCDGNGDFFLDPALLASRLSIDAEQLRRRMRLGLVNSLIEIGIGDDEGYRRLTVRNGNAVWRAVIDAERNVIGEESLHLGHPGGQENA